MLIGSKTVASTAQYHWEKPDAIIEVPNDVAQWLLSIKDTSFYEVKEKPIKPKAEPVVTKIPKPAAGK